MGWKKLILVLILNQGVNALWQQNTKSMYQRNLFGVCLIIAMVLLVCMKRKDFIYLNDYPNRQLFVKSETSASFSPQFKVRTVIEYDDKTLATGYVVTAIKVKNEGGKGEKPIYTKQEKNDI